MGLNTGFCGLSEKKKKNAWGSPNIPRTFLGSSSLFHVVFAEMQVAHRVQILDHVSYMTLVFGPSHSRGSGLGEMQTPTKGRLNHPSEEPVSSLTRDKAWADILSQVAFRRDNPSLTGRVVPWVPEKKAHKSPQPGKKRFPLLLQAKPIQLVTFSLLLWLLVQMFPSRDEFLASRGRVPPMQGGSRLQQWSPRPHRGLQLLGAGARRGAAVRSTSQTFVLI